MHKSQQRAIDYFKHFLGKELDKNPEYGDEVVEFEVEQTSYGSVWIKARTLMTKLPEGNLLRAVSSEFWLVLVGKHGALTVKMGPKSFVQFNMTKGARRKAFGMNFDIR